MKLRIQVLVLVGGGWLMACSASEPGPSNIQTRNPDAGSEDGSLDSGGPMGPDPGGSGGQHAGGNGGSSSNGDGPSGFFVEPEELQTLDVVAGEALPELEYVARFDGAEVTAGWSVDRGEVGAVSPGSGTTAGFTPTGTVGGMVKVQAGFQDEVIEREVFVRLVSEQHGADASDPEQQVQIADSIEELIEGGGIGGVGGEGLGGEVADEATRDALESPAGDAEAQALKLLYPYDETVWPRGLPAPLLMWEWSEGDADGIRIELETTSGSYRWSGTFGRPAILAETGDPFIRHPIPQTAWRAATDTAGGATPDGTPDRLQVRLTVAKDGEAYGPITQSWAVAPARLSGTIYYNSYGTHLARNFTGAVGGDGNFGGAVLSIRAGDPGPELVAGGDGDSSYCRTCHSVASDGSRLLVQAGLGSDEESVGYDLTPEGAIEFPLDTDAVYAGLTSDGSRALGQQGQWLDLEQGGESSPSAGLSEVATELGTPAFSSDGSRVVFNPMESASLDNPRQKLVVMSVDQETGAFSDPVVVVDDTGQPEETRPGWPAFFPTGQSIVFQHQSAAGEDGNGHGALRTRKGAKAQVAWTSISDPADVTPLDRLNGIDASGDPYLPSLAEGISMSCMADGEQVGDIDIDHSDDVNLNYEPTVSPIPAGGYAWVVFVSRRMYGNVATIPPFCSDPRGVDLWEHITPKKLWVAAVNLDMQPGEDGSHPAFYLPGQELLAGNARGFWVFDPCRPDGESCETGDQCCLGFCAPDPDAPDSEELVCTDAPPNRECSLLQERCLTAAECCDPEHACINGLCVQNIGPQ